jgi:PEP-CTERM motif
LFITDGLNGEKDGLLASITSVPEPSTWAMMLVGFGSLGLFAARSRRHRLTKPEGREKEPPEIGRFFFPAAGRGEIATGRLPRPRLL